MREFLATAGSQATSPSQATAEVIAKMVGQSDLPDPHESPTARRERDDIDGRTPRNEIQDARSSPTARRERDDIAGQRRRADVQQFINGISSTTQEIPGSVQVRSRWRGVVLELSSDVFAAELSDLDADGDVREVADFEMSSVDPDDVDLVAPGAVFYWYVGYEDTRRGRQAFSAIRFRRLPKWTRQELGAIAKRNDFDEFFTR